MRNTKFHASILMFIVIFAANIGIATGAPLVKFSSANVKNVTAGGTFNLPSVVIENATGITQVELHISVPSGFSVTSGILPGSGVNTNLWFPDTTDPGEIAVSCAINSASTIEVLKPVQFTAPAGWTYSPGNYISISGTVTGGSGTATFGHLTLLPVNSITFSVQPALSSVAASSGDQILCSATALDVWGTTVDYTWSDGTAGGQFSNAHSRTPAYVAPFNSASASKSIVLTCTAVSAADSSITASATVNLTLRGCSAGDLNFDGKVDKTDVDLILKYVLGDTDVTSSSDWDVNADGKIDLDDARWILQHLSPV